LTIARGSLVGHSNFDPAAEDKSISVRFGLTPKGFTEDTVKPFLETFKPAVEITEKAQAKK
jgi:hypothetical protein